MQPRKPATHVAVATPRAAFPDVTSSLPARLVSPVQAANLYAMSVFGEDALVNVSVEKKSDADGKLSGHVRIRSKTQGIALSLGDRITLVQRGPSATNAQP